ncbi:fibrillin-2-like [Mercenaria mercenaria]|uniref:fibrillin-2-like n=1 Tax=Mercenaria mercenaria TaxID=6596 RepID=UPI00234E3976|nr:fibrillin-2-like [Mercenaria mercenaria]
MSDIFRNISAMTVNVTNSSNGDTSVWISYVIQIGEQSTTDSVKNFQKQLFDLNKHIDLTIGLETAYLKTSEIITESTYNVCNISGKTHCDSETTNCVGHNGSYSCECKEGFNRTDDPFICSDIDECLDARYKCDNRGKCNNTDGNWTCTCESGFEPNFLDKYNISCIDINECQYKEKYVCNDGTCNNTIGDWVCECPSGYYRIENTTDSFTCLDIDECNNSSYSCSNDGNCSNSVGNWTCTCPSGYEPKVLNTYAKTCHDINECIQNDTYHCKGPVDSATCNNTVGGWRCECKVGYTAKNKTEHYRVCEDVNECYDPLACSGGKCKNENGTFDCVCPSGFTKISDKIVKDHFTCTDVNECDANKIKTNNSCIRGSCHNIPGDWECNCNDIIYNKKRYLGNHTNRCLGDFQYIGSITLYWSQYKKEKFQLVNMYFKEMISQAYNHSNATVSPSDSYAVSDIFRSSEVLKIEVTSIPNVLNVSYILHFGEPLSPVDIAKCQQKVFNTSKRYQFGTDYVYLQSERINNDNEFNLCDIDGKTRCDLQSTNCTVSNGSYSCPCKEGYNKTEDPFKCKDINECDGNVVHCEWNDCRNTAGSWECECNETSLFEKHNETYGLCQDIDECERNETYICNDGNCTDKVGGWECGCSAGFYAEPIKKGFIYSCKDFNECLRPNLHICSNGGTCQNTNGNWTCECRTGYEAVYINQTQIECRDINECEKPDQFTCTGPKNSSTCYDILGSWQCNCSEGFKPKNISSNIRTCEDINECHDESSCVKGECINTEGSFLCQCEPGYKIVSKAGHSACIDIDECAVNKNPCLEALGCENTEGDWTCLCSKGLDVRIVNESSKICGGQYQYVSSMSFTVVGTVVDVAKVQAALQKQIQEMYMQTLNDDSVWIEIIKIHGLQGAERRKRAPTRDISAEYIIHTSEKKNETELQEVEEVYKEQKCGNGTNNCQAEDIGGVSMVFNSVLVLNASAICNTSRNHCDEKISTCSSDEGKLKCLCNKGYEKKNTNSLQCFDTDECQSTDACPKGETCKNTVGSWDCSCQNGLKAIETEPGKRVCIDPCTKPHMECFISSTCKPFDNEDGYICGCEKGRKGKYCKEIDHNFKESKQQTTLIAVGSSLGGLVLILTAVILAVCRSRAGKIKEAERISMRHMDTNGFKSFDDSYLTNQYMRDRDDGGGSFYSHRLSNLSLPYEQQNYENRNGHLPKPHRLPRPSFHGSMPNLANGDAHVNRFDNRRYSVEEPRRVSSYNRDLDSNYDMDWRAPRNNMNGRRSPSPDYRRSMSPRPDYHRREKLNRSKDSGVGNGYSSGSNEYRRPEKRREYYYANRRSTNF